MPVLLKGEMMKENMIYGFMLIILLFMIKPLYGTTYTVEGKTITVPLSGVDEVNKPESQNIVRYLNPQTLSLTNYNEVIYQADLGELISNSYCRNLDRLGNNQYNKFWIEFKYYDTLMDKNEFFEKKVLTVNNKPIIGEGSYQLAQLERGNSLQLKLSFKLRNNWLYSNTPEPIKIKQGDALAVITMLCVNRSSNVYQGGDEQNSRYNAFTIVTAKAAQPFTFNFAQTCSIAGNKDQTIELKDVTVKELNEKTEVLGGRFNIKLNCPEQSVKNAYILFTDGNYYSNDGRGMGLLTPDSTTTTGNTVLVVKDEDDKPLIYRQPLPRNGGFFGVPEEKNGFYTFSQSLQQGQVSRTYKVYYRKLSPNRSVQPGEISAKLIYNIYYN
ncbi:fimbrial protein [Gallibacterium anatis]|uniref:fimbrial protein n=1 Tax=Gallibacterium anatis TaxID=750 RepID=UPI00267008AB|nr:fimbrial protein [Gallibacterium anatis]WKS97806.1 fimbrial protein [Gallibacterium anatis]